MRLEEALPETVRTLARLSELEGDRSGYELLSRSQVLVEQTSFDNWNGGTYSYRLQLSVPLTLYAQLGDKRERLERELLERIKSLTRSYDNEYVDSVILTPSNEDLPDNSINPDAALPYWKPGFLRLFISHVNAYRDLAAKIRTSLDGYGVSAFVAHDDIEPTEEWENEIKRALQTCNALVAMLTDGFHESKWTDQEVGVAIGRGILVVPVRLGIDPYGFIGRYQGFQGLRQKADQLADGIARVLAKNARTQMQMASALVASFEGSNSYAAAKANATRLELVTAWNDALKTRVLDAVRTNPQIYDAYEVPIRVKRLIDNK